MPGVDGKDRNRSEHRSLQSTSGEALFDLIVPHVLLQGQGFKYSVFCWLWFRLPFPFPLQQQPRHFCSYTRLSAFIPVHMQLKLCAAHPHPLFCFSFSFPPPFRLFFSPSILCCLPVLSPSFALLYTFYACIFPLPCSQNRF